MSRPQFYEIWHTKGIKTKIHNHDKSRQLQMTHLWYQSTLLRLYYTFQTDRQQYMKRVYRLLSDRRMYILGLCRMPQWWNTHPKDIRKLLYRARCGPRPLPRRIWIPKPGSTELRPLTIPHKTTRIRHKLLQILLRPLAISHSPNQFGFLPNRSLIQCWRRVLQLLPQYQYAVEFDYRKFYDSISTKTIAQTLKLHHFPPELSQELLDPNYTEEGVPKRITQGVLQGNPVSPLMSIMALEAKGLYDSPEYEYVGYADDGIIFTNLDPWSTALTLSTKASSLGLQLKPTATNIIQYQGQPLAFTFLGLKRSPDGVLEINSKSGRHSGTEVTLETLPEVYRTVQNSAPQTQNRQVATLTRLIDRNITVYTTLAHYRLTCTLLERLR